MFILRPNVERSNDRAPHRLGPFPDSLTLLVMHQRVLRTLVDSSSEVHDTRYVQLFRFGCLFGVSRRRIRREPYAAFHQRWSARTFSAVALDAAFHLRRREACSLVGSQALCASASKVKHQGKGTRHTRMRRLQKPKWDATFQLDHLNGRS